MNQSQLLKLHLAGLVWSHVHDLLTLGYFRAELLCIWLCIS